MLTREELQAQKYLLGSARLQFRGRVKAVVNSYLPQLMCPRWLQLGGFLPDCEPYAPSHCQSFQLSLPQQKQTGGRKKKKRLDYKNGFIAEPWTKKWFECCYDCAQELTRLSQYPCENVCCMTRLLRAPSYKIPRISRNMPTEA